MRFHATDAQLRPMGRSTTGVTGMKFKSADDELLSMSVIREGEDPDVFVVFENGMAKRTASSEWDAKGRATLGVKVANLTDKNGDLVGGLTVDENVVNRLRQGQCRADGRQAGDPPRPQHPGNGLRQAGQG